MPKTYDAPPAMAIDPAKKYTAVLDTSRGKITVELFPKDAPKTVNSFVFLAKEHFYDGVPFHRIIKGFMIQGGDPTGTGTGGPGYNLKAEFNDTKHVKGILSMARAQDPDSAGSQFFIMHGTSPHLDNKYTVFGKVTEGLDVVDKIATARTWSTPSSRATRLAASRSKKPDHPHLEIQQTRQTHGTGSVGFSFPDGAQARPITYPKISYWPKPHMQRMFGNESHTALRPRARARRCGELARRGTSP